MRGLRGRVTTRSPGWGWLLGGGGEVIEAGWLAEVERVEDVAVVVGEFAALSDVAVAGGEGDQVHAFEFVADVAPGVADGGLGDA